MDLIVYLIALALSGLVVGALARLALPGPDPMGILATIGVGLAGSFIAGLLTMAIWGRNGRPLQSRHAKNVAATMAAIWS